MLHYKTQRFQFLATLAVMDAGLLWNLVNMHHHFVKGLLDERSRWKEKKKKAHKPKKRSSMDVLHGVHDEASNAISSVPPTGTSVEILSLLDYTVYLTFSSGSFRG